MFFSVLLLGYSVWPVMSRHLSIFVYISFFKILVVLHYEVSVQVTYILCKLQM